MTGDLCLSYLDEYTVLPLLPARHVMQSVKFSEIPLIGSEYLKD